VTGRSPPTIWVDVEDLFDFRRHSKRPSGIQRVAFAISRELRMQGDPGAVRFLRHELDTSAFIEVAWRDVEALFSELAEAPVQPPVPPPTRAVAAATHLPHTPPQHRPNKLRRLYLPLLSRLPRTIRAPLSRATWHQIQALLELRQALAVIGRCVRPARPPPPPLITPRVSSRDVMATPPATRPASIAVEPGDVLLVLGAPWFDTDYAGRQRSFADKGGRVGLLLHDIIPLRRPEWFEQSLTRRFARWFATTLPEAHLLFTVSQSTARDVRRYAQATGLSIPYRICVPPIGSDFGPDGAAQPTLPAPVTGPYVLFVSTIEVRKNHALLVRVWRRMLDEMAAEQVPSLVFVGKIGWLVGDLIQQLRNTAWLGGKIILIESATDSELARLYRGCLFTLFPSLYEGWGLPVSESLGFGKPCLAADNSSLPEAGGPLARYFDADSVDSAYQMIRATLANPAGLEEWERRVQREFKPTPWRATAQAILAAIDAEESQPALRRAAADAALPG